MKQLIDLNASVFQGFAPYRMSLVWHVARDYQRGVSGWIESALALYRNAMIECIRWQIAADGLLQTAVHSERVHTQGPITSFNLVPVALDAVER